MTLAKANPEKLATLQKNAHVTQERIARFTARAEDLERQLADRRTRAALGIAAD
jgi:hypothetical protein